MASSPMTPSYARRGSYPIQKVGPEPRLAIPSVFFPDKPIFTAPAESVRSIPETIRAVRDERSRSPRTIVICLDGTGDQFDADNSNVVKFISCLKKDDPFQITYYQAGIGTYSNAHTLKGGLSAGLDMAVGSGLGIHIKDAYSFLMQNYREGDRISLLGFSRGAYTVRCLAGMLHKVGLLPAHNSAQISFAYKFFKDDTPLGWKMSAEFKKAFCTDVDVHFVGVWDCVASVGFVPRTLPFSKSSNNSIRYFRHAVALDEHRAKFKACHWVQRDPDQADLDAQWENERNHQRLRIQEQRRLSGSTLLFAKSIRRASLTSVMRRRNSASSPTDIRSIDGSEDVVQEEDPTRSERRQSQLETLFEAVDSIRHREKETIQTDVKEVWFTGAHADVGGGAVLNEERHQLSRIPLRWMIRQCFECETGMLFKAHALAEVGLDVPTLWPVYQQPKRPYVGPSPSALEKHHESKLPALHTRPFGFKELATELTKEMQDKLKIEAEELERDVLPEHVEDYFDALAPVNDQLEQSKAWWILEAWPVKVRTQRHSDDTWTKKVAMNMGRYRSVRTTEPKLHWTVKLRMDHTDYKIKARVDRSAAWNIVAS